MASRSPVRNSRSLTPQRQRHTADPQLQASGKKNRGSVEDPFSSSLRENLSTVQQALELYYKLNENALPQRCLSHNNAVSLYCTNEHRLVCVNCIYTESKHKSHKIRPIEQSLADLEKDISSSSFRVAQKMNSLQEMLHTSVDNVAMLENSRSGLVAKLDRQFDEIVRGLSNKYLELKTAIGSYYEEMIDQNKQANQQIKSACKTISTALQQLDRNDQHPASGKNGPPPAVFKHLVLQCLNTVQPAGTVQRRTSEVQHLEVFAERQLTRLKNQLSKHRWLKFW